jgi:MFS family permease
MAYAVVYAIHTLEMSALRGWGVAYLAFVAATTGASTTLLSPANALTVLGLAGTVASIVGNEAAIRFGRRRLIFLALSASVGCACLLGLVGPLSYPLAVMLLLLYGPIVWLDSASLTAGTAGTAAASRRGATLAVHSMLGYIGGLVGPLAVGWILDGGGGMGRVAWAVAFVMLQLFRLWPSWCSWSCVRAGSPVIAGLRRGLHGQGVVAEIGSSGRHPAAPRHSASRLDGATTLIHEYSSASC